MNNDVSRAISFDFLKARIDMLTVINDGLFKVSKFIRRKAERIRCKQEKLADYQKIQNDWMQSITREESNK
jgi:hypothetical protein